MNHTKVFEDLNAILRDVAETARAEGSVIPPLPSLTANTSGDLQIQELGLDSLAAVALVAGVEDHFDIALPPTILLDCRTVGEFVRAIAKLIEGGSHE